MKTTVKLTFYFTKFSKVCVTKYTTSVLEKVWGGKYSHIMLMGSSIATISPEDDLGTSVKNLKNTYAI